MSLWLQRCISASHWENSKVELEVSRFRSVFCDDRSLISYLQC